MQDLIDKLVEKESNKRPSADEIYKIVDKYMNENNETSLIMISQKSEVLKTYILEMSITKYLEQIKDRTLYRELRNKEAIKLGLSSSFLPFYIGSLLRTY